MNPLHALLKFLNRPCIVLPLVTAVAALNCTREQQSIVNFSHLRHLTESISLGGDSVDIVHVYANYPDYQWQQASDAGVEGVACVDDAARAAVVLMRHYELFRSTQSLDGAKRLLRFVLAMQADDGEFYNFILPDHTINRAGKTSYKSFGWWAARGLWCLGMGSRLFHQPDPQFADRLTSAFRRALPHVYDSLAAYGKSGIVSRLRVPRWLPYESGADVSSEMVLGLAEFASGIPDTSANPAMRKLLDGVMMMQDGSVASFPYGLHRSWRTTWHMWGNSQVQALAMAGRVLGDASMIESARREADGFYSRLLVDGFMKEFDVAKEGSVVRFEQIAYATRPMAVGLIRLYEATGREEYLVMAGLAASWLMGNNVLHRSMYDLSTGRCYDGILDSLTMNRNSGAESTIEALYTLVEIEHYPAAARYLFCKQVSVQNTSRYHTALYRNASGDEATVGVDLLAGRLIALTNDASREFQKGIRR